MQKVVLTFATSDLVIRFRSDLWQRDVLITTFKIKYNFSGLMFGNFKASQVRERQKQVIKSKRPTYSWRHYHAMLNSFRIFKMYQAFGKRCISALFFYCGTNPSNKSARCGQLPYIFRIKFDFRTVEHVKQNDQPLTQDSDLYKSLCKICRQDTNICFRVLHYHAQNNSSICNGLLQMIILSQSYFIV